MRLYAFSRSERAEKGQGAHKTLETVFTADTEHGREVVGTVRMGVHGNHITIATDLPAHQVRHIKATCGCNTCP